MFKYFLYSLVFVTSLLKAAPYEASLLLLDNNYDHNNNPIALNDNGASIGSSCSPGHQKIFIYNKNNETKTIELDNKNLYPKKINNAEQILAYAGQRALLWTKTLGFRYLNIFESNSTKPTDINDLGQVMGTYRFEDNNDRPFLWDYGVVTDLGPGSNFSNQFEELGYYVMNIDVRSINNKGEMAGCFGYGRYNIKKEKYTLVGYAVFYWDGDVSIISSVQWPPNVINLNNNGEVLVSNGYLSSYIWHSDTGDIEFLNMEGIKITDSKTVLGIVHCIEKDSIIPGIWQEGKTITIAELLGVDDIEEMAPSYSDNYSIERLHSFVDINKKGQILCSATIWGDSYPCLLNPVTNLNETPKGWEDFLYQYEETSKKEDRF